MKIITVKISVEVKDSYTGDGTLINETAVVQRNRYPIDVPAEIHGVIEYVSERIGAAALGRYPARVTQ